MKNSIDTFAKKTLFSQLKKIKHGKLNIVEGRKKYTFGHSKDIIANIHVKNPLFYRHVLFGGSIGSSESYIQGYWDSSDLTKVIEIMAINEQTMDEMEGWFKLLVRPIFKIMHYLNKNTLEGSKKNISQHYDLSNDFFSLFLDPTMMYSSGIYKSRSMSLESASLNKLDIICRKLHLKRTDKIIEIGSGWGGFAIYAANKYGCHVTTTTISKQQFQYVKSKIKKLKLEKKVTVLFKDYRDLSGSYDKLVSIEMIEAVGHQYYDSYFQVISNLLKDDGEALIQAITIKDQRYKQAIKSIDFIQKYIFPGSCIPSLTAIQNSLTDSTDMVINQVDDIGHHYAITLRQWRKNFNANINEIYKLGFDKSFSRMWIFYLCYCEGGFMEKAISDLHIHITKPRYRNIIK